MKEVRKTVEKIIKEEKTVYVANDGTEFYNRADCEAYENGELREMLLKRSDIEVTYKAGIPCNGGVEFGADDDYIWVKPLTDEAVEAICYAFESNYTNKREIIKGNWSCIRVDYAWEYEDTQFVSLRTVMENVKKQFNALGYNVEFKERRA